MSFCANCGKETIEGNRYCIYCGAEIVYETNGNFVAQATTSETGQQTNEYIKLITISKTTNLISIGLLGLGILSLLFINGWLGAVLCFVAEIVAVIPNTKVQKLFKSKNLPMMDKKTLNANQKILQKDLKAKNKDFKLSFVIALVALIFLIIFVITDFALVDWAKSLPADLQKDSYGSGIIEQIDTITDLHQYANSEMYNYGKNSSNSLNSGFVGTWEYSHTVNGDTMQEITPEEPILKKMKINEYNMGIFTYSISNEEFECDAYWVLNEYTDKQMSVTLTGKIAQYGIYSYDSVIYLDEHDCISIIDGDIMHYYVRCS